MSRLIATVILSGQIECLTGLHIGGTGGGYEIGGMDNPVIRDPYNKFPYIPGSSLKGKMRSLLEWAEGKVSDGKPYFSSDINDPISRIFGAPAEANRPAGPTRLIVRDCFPDEKTKERMRELESKQGLPKVEVKTEVNINRITSKPLSGPRKMERVPVGSYFDFAMVYSLYNIDGSRVKDVDLLDKLFMALQLLEDSALGGSGSRGCGQIQFLLNEPLIRKISDYENGNKPSKTTSPHIKLSDYKEEITKLKKALGGL
jgi:CRISPR-associated protein Csm3